MIASARTSRPALVVVDAGLIAALATITSSCARRSASRRRFFCVSMLLWTATHDDTRQTDSAKLKKNKEKRSI